MNKNTFLWYVKTVVWSGHITVIIWIWTYTSSCKKPLNWSHSVFWVDFKRKTQFEFELVSMGWRNPSRRSAANQEYKSSCVVDNLALFFPSELLQLAITYDFSLKNLINHTANFASVWGTSSWARLGRLLCLFGHETANQWSTNRRVWWIRSRSFSFWLLQLAIKTIFL